MSRQFSGATNVPAGVVFPQRLFPSRPSPHCVVSKARVGDDDLAVPNASVVLRRLLNTSGPAPAKEGTRRSITYKKQLDP